VKTAEGEKIYEAWLALDWGRGKAISMILRTPSGVPDLSLASRWCHWETISRIEDGFKVVKELDGIAIGLVNRRWKQHIATA
jgi:hypothetical protein